MWAGGSCPTDSYVSSRQPSERKGSPVNSYVSSRQPSERKGSPVNSYVSSRQPSERKGSPVNSYVSSRQPSERKEVAASSYLSDIKTSGASSKPPSNTRESPVGNYHSDARASGASSKPPSNARESPVGNYHSDARASGASSKPPSNTRESPVGNYHSDARASGASSKPPSNARESPVGNYHSDARASGASSKPPSNTRESPVGNYHSDARASGASSKPPSNTRESPVGNYHSDARASGASSKPPSNTRESPVGNYHSDARASGASSKPPSNARESPVGNYHSDAKRSCGSSGSVGNSGRPFSTNKNYAETPMKGDRSCISTEPLPACISSIKRCPVEHSDVNSLSAWVVPNFPIQGTSGALDVACELQTSPKPQEKPVVHEGNENRDAEDELSFHRSFLRKLKSTSSASASCPDLAQQQYNHNTLGVLYESHRRHADAYREAARIEEEVSKRRRDKISAETARFISEASRTSFSLGTHRKVYDQAMARFQDVRSGLLPPKVLPEKKARGGFFTSSTDCFVGAMWGPARHIESVKSVCPTVWSSHKTRTGGAQVALALLKSRFMAGWVVPSVIDRFMPRSSTSQCSPLKQFVAPNPNVVDIPTRRQELTAGIYENVESGDSIRDVGSTGGWLQTETPPPPTAVPDTATPHGSTLLARPSENLTVPYCSMVLPDLHQPLQADDVSQEVADKRNDSGTLHVPSPSTPTPPLSSSQQGAQGVVSPPPLTRLLQTNVEMTSSKELGSQLLVSNEEVKLSSERTRLATAALQVPTEEDKVVLHLLRTVRGLRLDTEKLVVELLHSTDEWGCWCDSKESFFRDLFVVPEADPVVSRRKRVTNVQKCCDPVEEAHSARPGGFPVVATSRCQDKFNLTVPPPPPVDVLLKWLLQEEQLPCVGVGVGSSGIPGTVSRSGEVVPPCAASRSLAEETLGSLEDVMGSQPPSVACGISSLSCTLSTEGNNYSDDYHYYGEREGTMCSSECDSSWSGELSRSSPASAPLQQRGNAESDAAELRQTLAKVTAEGRLPAESVLLSEGADTSPTPVHPVFRAEVTSEGARAKQKGHKTMGKRLKGFFSRFMCSGSRSTSVADGRSADNGTSGASLTVNKKGAKGSQRMLDKRHVSESGPQQ